LFGVGGLNPTADDGTSVVFSSSDKDMYLRLQGFPLELGIKQGEITMRRHDSRFFWLLCAAVLLTDSRGLVARATTINVPPDPAPTSIGSGTVLNVLPGGALADSFTASDGSTLNVSGGTVGNNASATGSTITVTNGSVGQFFVMQDDLVNISGGTIGSHSSAGSTQITMTGGSIGDSFTISGSAHLDLFGGSIGSHLELTSVGTPVMNVHGTQFEINGVPIPGLSNPGDSLVEDTRGGAVLTGVLADGSPLSFQLNNFPVSGQDLFTIGSLQLTVVPEPTSVALAGFGAAILVTAWRRR
jgi:hypothetical protein